MGQKQMEYLGKGGQLFQAKFPYPYLPQENNEGQLGPNWK